MECHCLPSAGLAELGGLAPDTPRSVPPPPPFAQYAVNAIPAQTWQCSPTRFCTFHELKACFRMLLVTVRDACNTPTFFSWYIIYLFFYYLLILRERDRQNTSGGGVDGEGDTEPEAGSGLRAVSTEPNAGLELTNREIMS